MSQAARRPSGASFQETRLDAFVAAKLLESWRRKPGRPSRYLVTTKRLVEFELGSPREVQVFCNGLSALSGTQDPLILLGVSASFDAEELEVLVRIAAIVDVDERELTTSDRELLGRLTQLLTFERLAGHLRGALHADYDAELANAVLAAVSASAGLMLVCVWEVHDGDGLHGSPALLILRRGQLRELKPLVRRWLTGRPDHPATPQCLGEVSTWTGATYELPVKSLPYYDGEHNYAIRDE
jgi:hypothetical protein